MAKVAMTAVVVLISGFYVLRYLPVF